MQKSPNVCSRRARDGQNYTRANALPLDFTQSLPATEVESEYLPTIESISEERKKRNAVRAQLEAQQQKEAASVEQNAKASGGEGGIEDLEEEADQQGAFNPETGEINWDCPCLGGMATGPCGEEFKAAFSCFVYSKEEPKGMDCIDNFKYVAHVTEQVGGRIANLNTRGMQDCFRRFPEIYGSEIDNDDAEDQDAENESTPGSSTTNTVSNVASDAQTAPASSTSSQPPAKGKLSGDAEPRAEPPSPEKSEPKRRELGLVPQNYQPDATPDAQKSSTNSPSGNSTTETSANVAGQVKRE